MGLATGYFLPYSIATNISKLQALGILRDLCTNKMGIAILQLVRIRALPG